MALSETTDALAIPRPADDGSDPFDTTDYRTMVNYIDAQFDKGSDVASATSITVPDESYFDITGTTTTAGFSTVNAGIIKMVQFDGALQLTHNSGSFNLPTGANITTAAGDRALFRSEGSGNWRCMWYQRASGAALKIADESIDSDAFVDGSIDAAHIASSAVTTAKINADAVTGAKIADDAIDSEHYTDASIDAAHIASNAVTTAKINADAVTGAKIADDAIDSEHYTDGSIDNAHLAADSVTNAKIADDALDSEHYTDGSIDSAHLAADVVTGAKIADDAVDSEHYTDASIDAAHIASNAVTTAKINADAVTGAKIADDALDSEHYTDGSIDAAHLASSSVTTAKIADDAVTLAKLNAGTDGELITWDASGDPAAVAAGSADEVLTSNGAGAAPTFQAAAGGGKIQAVGFSSAFSGNTTSSSYADITNGNVSLTTTKGGLIAVWHLAGYNSSISTNNYFALQLDSASEVGQVRYTQPIANQDQTMAGVYVWTSVSNATHRVDVRFNTSGGTFTLREGHLMLMEFDD